MPDPQKDNGALTVQTVDQDGKAPKHRLETASAAVQSYFSARMIEQKRDLRAAAIGGIFAGFPPVPPSQMAKMGAADMPNVNLKQFAAKLGQYISSWRAINAGGRHWATVKMKHPDPMEAKRRSERVTECFNYAIRRWGRTDDVAADNRYVLQSAVRDTQMGLFGIGVCHFADPLDWRWEVKPTRKCLVPEGTRIWMDNAQALFIEDQTSVKNLWAKRKKKGWSEEAVVQLLYNRANQNYPGITGQLTYGEWVEKVRANDTFLRNDFSPMPFVHSYVQEFTDEGEKGKITHGIFCDTATLPQPSEHQMGKDKTDWKGWLYQDPGGFEAENWSQVVSIFCDDPGPEGSWHGVKGFGDLIYDQCNANNLMWNRAAMAAIVSTTPMFRGGNEVDRQKLNQITMTPFGILVDLDVEQFKIAADIGAPMSVFEMGTRVMNQNSRSFPQNDNDGGGEQATATQVKFDRSDQASFTDLQIGNYRSTGGDPVMSEMYRRIAQPASKYPVKWAGGEAAKYFRDECARHGIPENELLMVECVEMNRNVGSGNLAVDVMKADQALTVATPGDGQLAARELKISALFGPDMVPVLVQREKPQASFEDVVINQENLDIQSGQTPAAFGFQPHEYHLGAPQMGTGHLAALAGIEQVANQMMDAGIQPGALADAAKLHSAIDAGIAHCGLHVAFMAEMPKIGGKPGMFEQQVKELVKLLHNMQQFSAAFAAAIVKTQQAQQQQASGGMSPEMAKAAAEIEIMKAKAIAEIEIKQAAAEAKLGNLAITHAARTEMKTADAELKLGLDAQKKVFEMENQRAVHQQELKEGGITTALDVTLQGVKGAQEAEHAAEKHQIEIAATRAKEANKKPEK